MSRFFISSGVNLCFPVFCPAGKRFLILSLLVLYLTFQAPAQNVFTAPDPVLERSVPMQGSYNQNFIKTITYSEGRSEVPPPGESFRHSEEIQYFDGLGRPSQVVQVGSSPAGNDIIQPILYDAFGRESVRTLPYTGARSGEFRSDAGLAAVNDFYSSQTPEGIEPDKRAFTSVVFDNSALNRVVSQTGPGSDWEEKNKSVIFNHLTNTEPVRGWRVSGTYSYSSFSYAAGTLYITETIDEEGSSTREYRDITGHVIMNESRLGSDWLQTVYIYDDLGMLRCVMPPEASDPNTDTA